LSRKADIVGFSLPDHPNVKIDRGAVRIDKVDPAVAAKGLSWSQMNEGNWTNFTRELAEGGAIRNLPNAVGAPFTALESLPLRMIYGGGAPGSCSTAAAPRSTMPASSSSFSSMKHPLHSVAIERTLGSKPAKQLTVSVPPCAPAATVAIYTVSFGLCEVGYGNLVPHRAADQQLFEEFVEMRCSKNLPRPHVLEVARPCEHSFHILLAKILHAADILPVNVEIIPVDCQQFTDHQRKHGILHTRKSALAQVTYFASHNTHGTTC
jgi:hypothetical protein